MDGPSIRKSRDFLNKVARTFALSCCKYFDTTGELPFIYRERQINSILLPSISKVANATFMEHPIMREGRAYGWLDYWAFYGNTTLLIEVKHAWFSISSKKVRKTTKGAYSAALKQLDMISPAVARDLSYLGDNIVKIALIVIPFYKQSMNITRLTTITAKDDVEAIYNRLLTGLSPTLNWSCIWLLHERLQKPVEYGDRHEIYPLVGLVAQIDNSLSK